MQYEKPTPTEPKPGTKDFFYLICFRARLTNSEVVKAATAYGIDTNIHRVSSQRWHFDKRGLDTTTKVDVARSKVRKYKLVLAK